MGLFFESVYRMVRDWWRALVRWAMPDPDYVPTASEAEIETQRVIEAATQHEEEVSAERDLGIDRSQHRIRPLPSEQVHGWTEAEFDLWWDSLTDKQKNFHHMEPVNFPEGLRLSGDDWKYWNVRALDRSRRYNYRNVSNPTSNRMGEDGRQS